MPLLRENEPRGGPCSWFLQYPIFYKSAFRNECFHFFLESSVGGFGASHLQVGRKRLCEKSTPDLCRSVLKLVEGGCPGMRKGSGHHCKKGLLSSKYEVCCFVRSILILPNVSVSKLGPEFSFSFVQAGTKACAGRGPFPLPI